MAKYNHKIEALAEILWNIHAHQLTPHYADSANPRPEFWHNLKDKTKNKKDVDKIFFRNMAMDILSRIEKL